MYYSSDNMINLVEKECHQQSESARQTDLKNN